MSWGSLRLRSTTALRFIYVREDEECKFDQMVASCFYASDAAAAAAAAAARWNWLNWGDPLLPVLIFGSDCCFVVGVQVVTSHESRVTSHESLTSHDSRASKQEEEEEEEENAPMTRWGQQCRGGGFEISTGYEVGKYDSISVGPSYRVKEGSNAFWSFVSCTQLAVFCTLSKVRNCQKLDTIFQYWMATFLLIKQQRLRIWTPNSLTAPLPAKL
jgi:hypothetical protein